MTIIYSAITESWAFQISDRLLTRNQYSGVKAFDPVSNKTVVFIANDGIVSISYTGTAYIGGITTDRWIAEVLNGDSLPGGKDFTTGSTSPNFQSLHRAIENLIVKLNEVWPTLPPEQKMADIGISFTGWQKCRSRPRIRPVLWWLVGDGTKAKPFKRKVMKRFWPNRVLASTSGGVQITPNESKLINNAILKERKAGTEVTAESSIVESLRNISSSYETIGSDFLGVRISLRSTPSIFINYFPDPNKSQPERPHKSPIEERSGMMIMVCDKSEPIPKTPPDIESNDVYFSPWIISESMVTPPSSVIGTSTLSLGSSVQAVIVGPAGSKGLIGGFISQSRPKRP